MKLGRPRVEKRQKHEEGKKVVQGTDGTDKEHETAYEFHVPAPWLAQVLLVHDVGGYGDLRQIIKKIVEEDLRWKQGEERQENGCSGHAEHVAEVRAGFHKNEFQDICRCSAAFDNTLVQNR